MSKISFRINTTYTSIENIFIDEYMPKAPAPLYSLVYIYGLRCACAGIQVDNKEIAEILSLPEKDVRACKREAIYRLKSRLGGLFFWLQIMRIV